MKKKIKTHLSFRLCITAHEARKECERINAGYSKPMRKKCPATVTPWISPDGREKSFIVWYHY